MYLYDLHYYIGNGSDQLQTCTVTEASIHNTNENHYEVFIGLTVLFMVTSVITTVIIVILSWKLYNHKRKNGTYVAS